MYRRALLATSLALVHSSCGGDAQHAGPIAPAVSAAPSAAPAAPGPAAGADDAPRADDSQLLLAVVQATLDAPQLQGFLHPEVPGRRPLRLVDHGVLRGLAPTALGAPVEIIPAGHAGSRPYLEIQGIRVVADGDGLLRSAEVRFSYPVEGLLGTADVQSDGRRWRVARMDLVER